MKKKSIEELIEEDKLDDNLAMCEKIRMRIAKRFKTVEAYGAHLQKLDDARLKREAHASEAKPTPRKKNTMKPMRIAKAS